MIRVAIDGPAGAGKSTIAKAAAKKLGFIYVDTGALYRSIGLYCVRGGINTKDASAVEAVLPEITVELKYENSEQAVILNGENVNGHIRTEEVSMAASNVSAIPSVREYLLDMQRNMAKENSVIMDGRDIATVVLPFAEVKIFLTASPEIRARRRVDQLLEKGIKADYEKVLYEVNERDYNDSHREIAPLKPSEESVIVDTSDLTLEESIDRIFKIITENKEK